MYFFQKAPPLQIISRGYYRIVVVYLLEHVVGKVNQGQHSKLVLTVHQG